MILDFHSHIYPSSFLERREEMCKTDTTFRNLYANPNARMSSAPSLISAMNDEHVEVAVIMGVGWTNKQLAKEANNYILESSQQHPNRLVPFCSVNPLWGDAALTEIERCHSLGARGIGEFHPDTQGFDIANKDQMAPLMALAHRLDMIILTHTSEPVGHSYPGKGRTTPDKVYTFIQNFPHNIIVCAHWGGGLPFYALMPEVYKAMDNVYVDSAASPLLYKANIFLTVAELLGPNKILLGTDYPLLPHRQLLSQINNLSLTPANKQLILGNNGRELLSL